MNIIISDNVKKYLLNKKTNSITIDITYSCCASKDIDRACIRVLPGETFIKNGFKKFEKDNIYVYISKYITERNNKVTIDTVTKENIILLSQQGLSVN